MQEISGYEALPTLPELVPRREYLRSKSDPHVLISTFSGDCYVRRDGAVWEWPAYQITRERDGSITRNHAFGYCDSKRYEPQTQSAAA